MCPRTQPTRRRVNIMVSTNPASITWLNKRLNSVSAVFAGKDASRGLAMSSLKPEDAVPDWDDLEDKYKTVLEEWYTFFSKRYNIVGKVSTSKMQKL
jgi:hypothetical protein